jgi:chorismate dehydratase
LKVCSVSYLNSIPFVFGLENRNIGVDLSLDIPSRCAEKLQQDEVDLALVPVAIIPSLESPSIVSPFCISSDGAVQTVCLFSEVPLDQIDTIFLDYHSKTSNALVQLLSKHFWRIQPKFIDSKSDFEKDIKGTTAGVIIGDRAYDYRNIFSYIYDLSEEWKTFTGLPFVFACWVSNKPVTSSFEEIFSEALKYGISNLELALSEKSNSFETQIDKKKYLTEVISYDLTEDKRKSMKMFLDFIS